MFYDKLNLVQIIFHIISCTATALFIIKSGNYRSLWKIWLVGG
jgi:hypothetical protein